jgi:2-methylisocitrate lyase-like PEP mutase family enzyme
LPFPFVLTARAEGFLRGKADLDDVIARLKAFEAAGADVLSRLACPISRRSRR